MMQYSYPYKIMKELSTTLVAGTETKRRMVVDWLLLQISGFVIFLSHFRKMIA
jgi:hypothetical protein